MIINKFNFYSQKLNNNNFMGLSVKPCLFKNQQRDEFCKKNKKEKRQTPESFLKNSDRNFYNKTRSLQEIEIYEKNKTIVQNLIALKNSPSNSLLVKILIQKALNYATNKNLADCNLSEYCAIYELISKRLISSYTDNAAEKYFAQDEIKDLNLESIRKNMLFLSNNDYKIPHQDCKKDLNLSNFEQISLNDSLIRKYEKNEVYDLPDKFFIAAVNEKKNKGDSYIKDFVPQMFENSDLDEVFSAFDILSAILRKTFAHNFTISKEQSLNFSIGDKKLNAEFIGSGFEGNVFKITDKNSPQSVIFKVYTNPQYISSSDVFGSVAIHREATQANCSDITKLMLANPLSNKVIINGQNKITGGWEIDENANEITADYKKPVYDWLREYNLYHLDKPDSRVNGCLVDFGFISINRK